MNFCFVLNDKYVKNLFVLLTSVFSTNPGSHKLYVLTSGIKEDNIIKLKKYVEANKSIINVIKVDDSCLVNVPLKRKDFDKTPYYKLLLPIELPQEINRVLYMDVDIVVRGSLEELYNTNMSDKYFAAVPDPLVNARDPEHLRKIGVNLDKGERYFNSGVILFNLEEMRKNYTIDVALDYIRKNGATFKFHDQEVLNGLYFRNYCQLEEKYNYLTVYRSITDMVSYCAGNQKDIERDIIIFHYANPTKPWNRDYIGKYENLFWKYAELSPSYDLMKCNRRNSIVEQGKALLRTVRRKISK